MIKNKAIMNIKNLICRYFNIFLNWAYILSSKFAFENLNKLNYLRGKMRDRMEKYSCTSIYRRGIVFFIICFAKFTSVEDIDVL